MKKKARFSFLLLIFMLVLFPVAAVAQETDEGGAVEVAEELSGFYIFSAFEGGFEEGEEEDTYTLTLSVEDEYVPVVIDSPYTFAWRDDVAYMIGNWAAVPDGLEGTAMLELEGNITLWLTLSEPGYDFEAQTLTFTAKVTDAYTAEKMKDPIPEMFESGVLFVETNYEFETGMMEGLEARGGRFPRPDKKVPPKI